MTDSDRFIIIGAQINSALYFTAVFVAALSAHNLRAEYVDIAAVGVAYLSYLAQAIGVLGKTTVALSIVLGAAAGALLLV